MNPIHLRKASKAAVKRIPADRARVNLHDKREMAYWTARLSCSEDQLSAAVGTVGVLADQVEGYLKQSMTQLDGSAASLL